MKSKENSTIKSIKLISKDNLNDLKKNKNKENNNTNNIAKSNNIKIQQIKNNEIPYKGKIKLKEEPKYFDFHAHFKYNELVEALNKLKSSKNESTSNTSNANINNNNNINSKENSNYENNNQNIVLKDNNNNMKKNSNNNSKQNKSKPRNHKGVSRNVQMNNYIKYIGYIEECKDNNITLTNVSNNFQPNKTSYLPQPDLVKERMNVHLEEINHLKHKILLDKQSKEVKNDQYDKNIDDNSSKNNNNFNNLISTSLISNNKKKNIIAHNDNQGVTKNDKNANLNCINNNKKKKIN